MTVTLPPLPLTGGCQCGALRYALGSAPLAFYICHCSQCQRQSGSAFGESVLVRFADLAVSGATASRWRDTASGRRMEGVFCPGCGARLYHRHLGGDTATVRGGSFDDRSWLQPAAQVFTADRQPWVPLLPGVPDFPGSPDMAAIRARWAVMTAG